MNRSPSIFLWILLALLIAGTYLYHTRSQIHRIIDPYSNPTPSAEALETANQQYAALLLFLQTYPDRSIPFIKDIQSKFFGDSCTVKPNLSFQTLAQFPNGMIFV